MMLQFTKGKWFFYWYHTKAEKHKRIKVAAGVKVSEGAIKTIATVSGTDAESRANARLIANAPEMYRLMKSVVDFDHTAFKFDTDGNLVFTREKYDEFRDLLARIDGKESDKT